MGDPMSGGPYEWRTGIHVAYMYFKIPKSEPTPFNKVDDSYASIAH